MNTMMKAGVLAGAALFAGCGIAMADTGTTMHKLGGTLTMTHGMLRTSGLDGATIYNGQGKDIGTLKNILMNDAGGAPMAVASVGSRMVSFPFSKLKFEKSDPKSTVKNPDYSVVYPGATKALLKGLPKFHYDTNTSD